MYVLDRTTKTRQGRPKIQDVEKKSEIWHQCTNGMTRTTLNRLHIHADTAYEDTSLRKFTVDKYIAFFHSYRSGKGKI